MIKHIAMALTVLMLSWPCVAGETSSAAGPVRLTQAGRNWVELTLKKLSLEEKVGQMLNIRYFTDFRNFGDDDYRTFRDQLRKYHIGSVTLTVHVDGPVLLKNPPLEVAAMTNRLQRDSRLPLLIAADFERGLTSRVSFVPDFPDAMAFGATGKPAYAERFGAVTAQEARAIGIHWDFSPVADVNSNPDNPIINTRSFGEDPVGVGEFLAAFVKGAKAHGMLTTAKHFPGHGDTGTDSHLGVARVGGDLSRLEAVELPPFRQAIAAGVDAVMVAHLAVPALEPDPEKVATVSPRVVTDVLRKQMGFDKVVVTDALEMRGLTSLYPPGQGSPTARAAVDAVKAGNDVILWPTDLDGAFHAIVDAVRRKEISQSRIDDSVRRILRMKASLGLNNARLVDTEQVSFLVGKAENMRFAQQVADDALTLVRSNRQIIPFPKLAPRPTESETFQAPIAPGPEVVAIILTDSVRGPSGHAFEAALKARRADATVFYVDTSLAASMTGEVMRAVRGAGRIVVAAYVAPVAAKQVMVDGKLVNSVGVEQGTGELLRQVLEIAASKTVVVALGNPYVLRDFSNAQNYVCTYSGASTSELSAVKYLFGKLEPAGRLPVTLPGIAARGFAYAGAQR